MFIGWRKPSIIVSDTARMYVLYVRTLCTLSRTAKCYFVSHSLTYYAVLVLVVSAMLKRDVVIDKSRFITAT